MSENESLTALQEDAVPRSPPLRESSGSRLPLLAFVADDETETALRGGLLNVVEGAEIHRGTIVHAIKLLAKEPTPRTLIVDISGVHNPLAELDNLSSVCTPDVSVMVIGEYNEISLYRQLTRDLGVVEYMHKPVTRERVARLFVPHIIGVTPDNVSAHGGSVIAVCGARGGVGTTTVAVNLALQLANMTRGHVALLDLHLQQGAAALMLGLKPVGGLRIALEHPERADALFLERVSVEINDRLRLVAADEPFDSPPSPTPDGVRSVLSLLQRRFNYVVVDLPAPNTPAWLQALRTARHMLAVMAPDLAGIRDGDRLRQLAKQIGTSHSTIVLNRFGMPGGLKLPMIEQGLGDRPSVIIPELAKQLARAANLGKPALDECAQFRKAIAVLAKEVSGTAASKTNADHKSLFSWMGRR